MPGVDVLSRRLLRHVVCSHMDSLLTSKTKVDRFVLPTLALAIVDHAPRLIYQESPRLSFLPIGDTQQSIQQDHAG